MTSRAQGGDVQGTCKNDVTQGKAISIAEASFDPGYDLDSTLAAGYIKKDALVRGYCDYGTSVGEAAPSNGKRRS